MYRMSRRRQPPGKTSIQPFNRAEAESFLEMSKVWNQRWWVLCIGLMLLAMLASAVILVAFWRSRWQTVIVEDASQPADFELHARPGDLFWLSEYVNRLDLIVTGQIDGTAELSIEGDDPVRLSGNIHHERHGDWYDSAYQIHYEPTDVKSGHLKFRCRFR
jgi:hypothetical protein